jgi:hypothetical protein
VETRVVGASSVVARHVGSRLLSARAAVEEAGSQDVDARMSRALPKHVKGLYTRHRARRKDRRFQQKWEKRWQEKQLKKEGWGISWQTAQEQGYLKHLRPAPKKRRPRRAGRKALVAAGGRVLRDGGHQEMDQLAVGASRTVTRRLRAPFRRAGEHLGRSAVRGSWRLTRRGAGIAYNVTRTAGQRAASLAVHTTIRAVKTVHAAVTAVTAAAGAAGAAALPGILALVAAVAALCALLPSFITSAGIEEQKRQHPQQRVCAAATTSQPAATAEQVAEFLPHPHGTDKSASLTDEQRQYASAIVEEGQKLGLPPRAWAIALMTALQESTLGADTSAFTPDVNHDVGIFQQRAKVGWYADGATEAENTQILNDVHYAARTFYSGHDVAVEASGSAGPVGYHIPGLVDIPGWESRDLGSVAQSVQKSAFPTYYMPHEATAASLLPTLVTQCTGSAPGTSGLAGVDEYQPWWQGQGGATAGYDPQGFAWAQCTSYVAFALRTYSPYKDFQNNWKGQHFGNAKEWDAAAKAAGIRVDQMPAVGAVAERTAGSWGHVAYIVAVNPDGTFVVNEYNHVTSRAFSSRTTKIGSNIEDFNKILHFEE